MSDIIIDISMYLTYFLVVVSLLALVFFSVKQFVSNFGQSKKTLFGLVGLVVLFVLAYLFSSGSDISSTVFEKVGSDPEGSRMIGAGLIYTYILFGGVVVALLAVEIMKPFKK